MSTMNTVSSIQKVPMEVLVLGLCRTGTMSMKIALEELGYSNVYHFSSIEPEHTPKWIAAINAKYEPSSASKSVEEIDFGEILGEYSAVTDIPTACFVPELLAAYPHAKVILTTRSTASWHISMLRTIHALYSSRLSRFLLLFRDKDTQQQSRLNDLIVKYYFRGDIKKHGRDVFEEHNQMVRDVAKREGREFLEFEIGDGWSALCKFLKKEAPIGSFPRANEAESWRKVMGLDNSMMMRLAGWVLVFVAPVLFMLWMAA